VDFCSLQVRTQMSIMSGVSRPKFVKFLQIYSVEALSPLLNHAFRQRYSNSLWNASTENDGGIIRYSVAFGNF